KEMSQVIDILIDDEVFECLYKKSQKSGNSIEFEALEILRKNLTPSKKGTKFIPPTVEDVDSYIFEKGYNINADDFVNLYKSKGWMVGKNKMKNWKSAVSLWNSKNGKNGKNGNSE